MTRWLAAYFGAVVVIAWAVLVAWAYRRRREPVPTEPWAEPEWDSYQSAILR